MIHSVPWVPAALAGVTTATSLYTGGTFNRGNADCLDAESDRLTDFTESAWLPHIDAASVAVIPGAPPENSLGNAHRVYCTPGRLSILASSSHIPTTAHPECDSYLTPWYLHGPGTFEGSDVYDRPQGDGVSSWFDDFVDYDPVNEESGQTQGSGQAQARAIDIFSPAFIPVAEREEHWTCPSNNTEPHEDETWATLPQDYHIRIASTEGMFCNFTSGLGGPGPSNDSSPVKNDAMPNERFTNGDALYRPTHVRSVNDSTIFGDCTGCEINIEHERPPHQVETRPISEEQLRDEVMGVYRGLQMVEKISNGTDDTAINLDPKLSTEQWQHLIDIHRNFLPEHHDLFLASLHPSQASALRRLAERFAMPEQIWCHGIDVSLELMRRRGPDSCYLMKFVYLALCMMTASSRHESGEGSDGGDEDDEDDQRNQTTWTGTIRRWYSRKSTGDTKLLFEGPNDGIECERRESHLDFERCEQAEVDDKSEQSMFDSLASLYCPESEERYINPRLYPRDTYSPTTRDKYGRMLPPSGAGPSNWFTAIDSTPLDSPPQRDEEKATTTTQLYHRLAILARGDSLPEVHPIPLSTTHSSIVDNTLPVSPPTDTSASSILSNGFTCSVCKKGFPRQCDMKKHEQYHQKTLQCPDCDACFGRQQELDRHHSTVHEQKDGKRKFKCDETDCSDAFSRLDNLKRHKRRKH